MIAQDEIEYIWEDQRQICTGKRKRILCFKCLPCDCPVIPAR